MRKNISHLAELVASAKAVISRASNVAALDNVHIEYLGEKGHLTLQVTTPCGLPPEERPTVGAVTNEAKERVQQALNTRKAKLGGTVLNARLVAKTIDASLPGCRIGNGGLHPVIRAINRVEGFSGELGFTVAAGLEIGDDYHNFDTLNIPGHHPVRVSHDTFRFDATRLLRIQTSGVQICTMRVQQPPIRIIMPGRTCRNDYDQTHTSIFHQMEGLTVDTNINFTSLKGTLHDFLRSFFEENLQIHFRPSYFPFIEPSVEVNVMGKNGRWLEALGCGTAHSNMPHNVGVDLEVYSGFAFGIRTGRLVMLCYGITDLCLFFENDLCFLKQFKQGRNRL